MAKQKLDKRWTEVKQGNYKFLPENSGVSEFSKITGWGDKNSAITNDGIKVERQELIYAEGYGLVKCVPYELHFIYEDKSKKRGRWAYMCTCGSIAGIISYNEVKTLMTVTGAESGYILACIAHTTAKQNTGVGKHADGSHE